MSDSMTLKRTATAHYQFTCMQVELQRWIEQVLGETDLFEKDAEFAVALRDGRILCRLLNKIRPGSIAKEPQKTQAAFKMMEYVSWFAIAAVNYGVEFVFLPSDLVSGNNMMSVLATLYELAELAASKGEAPPIEKLTETSPDFHKPSIQKKRVNIISKFEGGTINTSTNTPTTQTGQTLFKVPSVPKKIVHATKTSATVVSGTTPSETTTPTVVSPEGRKLTVTDSFSKALTIRKNKTAEEYSSENSEGGLERSASAPSTPRYEEVSQNITHSEDDTNQQSSAPVKNSEEISTKDPEEKENRTSEENSEKTPTEDIKNQIEKPTETSTENVAETSAEIQENSAENSAENSTEDSTENSEDKGLTTPATTEQEDSRKSHEATLQPEAAPEISQNNETRPLAPTENAEKTPQPENSSNAPEEVPTDLETSRPSFHVEDYSSTTNSVIIESVSNYSSESEDELCKRGRSSTSFSAVSDESMPEQEKSKKMENLRLSVIKEIVATEQAYVKHLRIIVNNFMESLNYNAIVDEATVNCLFSNVRDLEVLNSKLLARLQDKMENSSPEYWVVGDVFLGMIDELTIYSVYCANKEQSTSMLLKLTKDNDKFNKWLKEVTKDSELSGLGIGDFLVKPVQRICRYPLLLKELLKYTSEYHLDYEQLVLANQRMEELTSMVNETKRMEENFAKIHQVASLLGMENLADNDERMFVKEGELIAMLEGKSTKARSFVFFLFSDLLVFGKRANKRHSLSAKSRQITYRGEMKMAGSVIQTWNDATYIRYGWQLMSAAGVKMTLGAQSQAEKDQWLKAFNEVNNPILSPEGSRVMRRTSVAMSSSFLAADTSSNSQSKDRSSRNLIRASFASLNAAQLAKGDDASTWKAASLEAAKDANNDILEENKKLDALNEWKRKCEEEIRNAHVTMVETQGEKEAEFLLRSQQKRELTELKEKLVTLTMQIMQIKEGQSKSGESGNTKKVMHDTTILNKQLNEEKKARRELSLWKEEFPLKMDEISKKLKIEVDAKAKLQEKHDKLLAKVTKAQEKKSKKT